MLQIINMEFLLYYLSIGHLQEVKDKTKVRT